MSSPSDSQHNKRILLWVSLITLLYACAWLIYYGQTPLGLSPALDNQQTLLLAQQMSEGELPAEPFHRAPFYPYLLSLFLKIGIPFSALPTLARILNAVALLICASTMSASAMRIWKTNTAGWISGLLIGLNPVILFFTADPFDILPATAFLCLALHQFLLWRENATARSTLLIAVYLAIGAALRSHLLPIALAWPIFSVLLSPSKKPLHFAAAIAPCALSFLLLGAANLKVTNEFRIMPWQGAYNLWAGNGPQASGKIYTQQIRVDIGDTYDNPAKLESIALYELETANQPPHSIDAMNAYWKEKTFNYLQEHPLDWLSLMWRKSYYFLNNYEQYDNKTYGLQKQLHWPLKWNPIHWGALLVFAVFGALIGLRVPHTRNIIIALIVLFTLYAAGTIWFYTPNRFRVPMIPILCLLCGGLTCFKPTLASTAWKLTYVVCGLLAAGIAYSNIFDAANTNTWEEDYALLSNASLRTQQDEDAIVWANKALQLNPQRIDMHDNVIQARFNLWALSNTPKELTTAEARQKLEETKAYPSEQPSIHAIIGIYEWKLGRKSDAVRLWKSAQSEEAFAYLCLFWTGNAPQPSESELSLYQDAKGGTLLQSAIAIRAEGSSHPLHALIENLFKPTVTSTNQ